MSIVKDIVKVQVTTLYKGQQVSVANCVGVGTVVGRTDKNLYLVQHPSWKAPVVIARNQIGVNVQGNWVSGPANEQLAK